MGIGSLGIKTQEESFYSKFVEDIKFNGERYEVKLSRKLQLKTCLLLGSIFASCICEQSSHEYQIALANVVLIFSFYCCRIQWWL